MYKNRSEDVDRSKRMTWETEFSLTLYETSVIARRAVSVEYTDLYTYSVTSKGSFSYKDIKTAMLELHVAIGIE